MEIRIQEQGPYVVEGNVPLVSKTQVVTEYGEPIAWQKDGDFPHAEMYELCRCGHSADKPFCDFTHDSTDWDATETAEANTTAERRVRHAGGRQIVVRRDYSLCASAGFCGTRLTNVQRMLAEASPDDTAVRSQIIAMIERCPSGSYSYALDESNKDNEPDLPAHIVVVTEITSEGPIDGPLWVTGNISIERADGQPVERRNRVTLCRCGQSQNKPFCDGMHRAKPT